MGEGRFSEVVYNESTATRRSTGVRDFEYTETAKKIHNSLDPKRILNKPFGLLESRDSAGNPESTPIIITFDVTGSNRANAVIAQKKLPDLMAKLQAVLENPQVAVWANDDVNYVGTNGIQLGEFESDNRIDDSIRNIWITGKGGNNDGESYELLLYAAARKVITDSMEKRGKKGYMFLYADEPFFTSVSSAQINDIFNDTTQADIQIADIIAEAKQKWNIFLLWPSNGYIHARSQYVSLFGEGNVETLQDPNMLCDKIASIVSREEEAFQTTVAYAAADSEHDYAARIA